MISWLGTQAASVTGEKVMAICGKLDFRPCYLMFEHWLNSQGIAAIRLRPLELIYRTLLCVYCRSYLHIHYVTSKSKSMTAKWLLAICLCAVGRIDAATTNIGYNNQLDSYIDEKPMICDCLNPMQARYCQCVGREQCMPSQNIDPTKIFDRCNFYSVCCWNYDIKTNPKPTIPVDSSCGKRNFGGIDIIGNRIINRGEDESGLGEFPWMAFISSRDVKRTAVAGTLYRYECGGSLVHAQVVLTAAHCVKGKKNLFVRVGVTDTRDPSEPWKQRAVRDVIVHEGYTYDTRKSESNDVALLVLESAVDLVQHISLVCLPEQGAEANGKDCLVTGWGQDAYGDKGKYQRTLKNVQLPIVARNTCTKALQKTRLGRQFKLDPSFICAGGVPGKDACTGDGGSPLVCPIPSKPDSYQQVGIVSWGVGCGNTVPGVYTNVAQFRDWIDHEISKID